MKAIIGAKIYYNNEFIKNNVLLFDNKTQGIIPINEYNKKGIEEEIILNGELVFPGFINLHLHGHSGADSMDSTFESLEIMAKGLIKDGVTAFVPTTISNPKENLQKALNNIKNYKDNQDNSSAKVLGAHLEGPFINKEMKGAQPEEGIYSFDENFVLENKDVIKIITISPEIENNLEYISKFKNDFCFSVGHTNASFDIVNKALENGARGITHLFNRMSGFNHREPGCTGAALVGKVFCEIVCDNIHVDKNLYSLVKKVKDIDEIMLVTDSMRAAGLYDGEYDLGGQTVYTKNEVCTLKDGTLAGSVLKMNRAAYNFYNNTDSSFEDIAKITSQNQAKYLKLNNEIGNIKKGFFADYTIVNKDFDVLYTIINGNIVYKK